MTWHPPIICCWSHYSVRAAIATISLCALSYDDPALPPSRRRHEARSASLPYSLRPILHHRRCGSTAARHRLLRLQQQQQWLLRIDSGCTYGWHGKLCSKERRAVGLHWISAYQEARVCRHSFQASRSSLYFHGQSRSSGAQPWHRSLQAGFGSFLSFFFRFFRFLALILINFLILGNLLYINFS